MSDQAPMRVRPHDPQYQRDAAAEAEFWSQPHAFSIDALSEREPDVFQRYNNRRFTGDPVTPWSATIARYGRFRNALVLGAGGIGQERIILASNPAATVTFTDLSEAAVAKRERQLGSEFPGRVRTVVLDLNFATFEPRSYDLIVSSSTFHHLINLEHVIEQVNTALTDDGYFFLQDYVGEPRFRFPESKRRLFEVLHERAARLRGEEPSRIEWVEADGDDYSPFEAVRSDETLPLLRARMHEELLRTAGAVSGLFLYTRFHSPPPPPVPLRGRVPLLRRLDRQRRTRLERRLLGELLFVDEVVCDSGLLLPTSAFGVYRKRP
jgi:SAM-dependent methyltransferase